ncbi:MAG: hypothetical protein DWQ05_21140 [Calditrichaeota bacterium]|nr:MAG: hypothetical protein DWQ05_21140 [Calditrichota bacterium]
MLELRLENVPGTSLVLNSIFGNLCTSVVSSAWHVHYTGGGAVSPAFPAGRLETSKKISQHKMLF